MKSDKLGPSENLSVCLRFRPVLLSSKSSPGASQFLGDVDEAALEDCLHFCRLRIELPRVSTVALLSVLLAITIFNNIYATTINYIF